MRPSGAAASPAGRFACVIRRAANAGSLSAGGGDCSDTTLTSPLEIGVRGAGCGTAVEGDVAVGSGSAAGSEEPEHPTTRTAAHVAVTTAFRARRAYPAAGPGR